MTTYDDAIDALYGTPLDRFVGERTRLAAALRAAGEKDAAARLAKHTRPTASAWVVNQLYRHARDAYDAMLDTAARLRTGDGEARSAHRDAMATLRHQAARLLQRDGHTASEATLRRVSASLAAIAAQGGFDPDPPGALATDREAPGFDVGLDRPAPPVAARPQRPRASVPLHAVPSKTERMRAAAAAEREAAARAEAQRREADRKRVVAERKRLETALRVAERARRQADAELASLRERTRAVEAAVATATEAVHDLERQLRALDSTS